MNKNSIKYSVAAGAVLVASTSVAHAEDISCDGSLVPQVCKIFAGAGSFSVSGILQSVFAVVIAILVIFILFQIVKAVFDWVGKSGDEKARSAAIKSITNAVVAGIVLLVAILIVVVGSSLLNIGTPAVNYVCVASSTLPSGAANLTARGTLLSGNLKELPDVQAQEGAGVNNKWNEGSAYDKYIKGTTGADEDVVSALKKVKCVQTSGESSGKEYSPNYWVVAKVGLKK
ncbi:MAG: hypothetical protein WCJ19_00050 [bacterium]